MESDNFLKKIGIRKWQFDNGVVLSNVHRKNDCIEKYCPFHRPSNHHMKEWPTIWRSDRWILERVCPCGVGHPDPDILFPSGDDGTHGCCGCCYPC